VKGTEYRNGLLERVIRNWENKNEISTLVSCSPVEEVVCDLGVDHHASLTSQDLIEGRNTVGNHLSVLVLQHLVQHIHQVQLYICVCMGVGVGVGVGGERRVLCVCVLLMYTFNICTDKQIYSVKD